MAYIPYNTGNPVPSADARDRSDNSANLDIGMNGRTPSFFDRKGLRRETWLGMERRFNGFIDGLGWSSVGTYAPGVIITSHSQFVEREGQPYALKSTVPATIGTPYVVTGDWAAEGVNFKLVGDSPLREDLSNKTDKELGIALLGRATVAVDSVAQLLSCPKDASQIFETKSYSPGWGAMASTPRGRNAYTYMPSMLKSRHTGGDIISVTSNWNGSSATLPDFLNNVGETDPTGAGCWVSIANSDCVGVDQFGATPGFKDLAKSNYAAIRAALKSAVTRMPSPGEVADATFHLEFQRSIVIGVGEYFTMGNSPCWLNRTEMTALVGNYRYRSGLKWEGCGQRSSTITIISDPDANAETWIGSTYDANYPLDPVTGMSDCGVMDYVEFSGITFRGAEDVSIRLPTNRKTSGFRWITSGFEKYIKFNDCTFEWLDQGMTHEGYGNADHNKWIGCTWRKIRDRCIYYNNNQSVANSYIACDMEEIHGKCFWIGPLGGGDVTWVGGSIILYPEMETETKPFASQNESGFIFMDGSGVTSGPSSGPNNSSFYILKARFETYEAKQHFVFRYRADATDYGTLRVHFQDCTMVDPHIFEGGYGFPAVPYAGVYTEGDSVVKFSDCLSRAGYTYTVGKFAGEILFENHEYLPKDGTPVLNTNLMSAECKVNPGTGGTITSRGMKTARLVANGDYSRVVGGDFTKSDCGRITSTALFQAKHNLTPWPQRGISGPIYVFLPAGSIVTGITIYKPGEALVNPAADYGLSVVNAASSVTLMAAVTGLESRTISQSVRLAEPYVVGDGDYLLVSNNNSNSTQAFASKAGYINIEYI